MAKKMGYHVTIKWTGQMQGVHSFDRMSIEVSHKDTLWATFILAHELGHAITSHENITMDDYFSRPMDVFMIERRAWLWVDTYIGRYDLHCAPYFECRDLALTAYKAALRLTTIIPVTHQ
jgi:hypothetical protein